MIGHVGRFVEQKNHSFLLDVFDQMYKIDNNVKLLLLGDGPLLPKIEEKAKKLGVKDKVIFAGSKMNVWNYYSMMDLFIFPSLYEGLGMTAIEAQANGLYCIVSDNITKEVMATNNIEFMSTQQSPKLWAEEAMRHINCRIQINYFAENEKMLQSVFNIKNQAKKLLFCYQRLLID